MATRPRSWFAHESAIIDEGAHIGAGTKIWHFTHISAGARIGKGCHLGSAMLGLPDLVEIEDGASLNGHVRMGDFEHQGSGG